MPKDTFNKLSEDKKHRIFNAAVKEFSTRRFSEASINQIVKAAGIPRGSFYQYFDDKEDIFLYMLTEILKEKRNVLLSGRAIDPDVDFLETYMQATKESLQWGRDKPEYTRISMLMETDDSSFIIGLRKDMTKGLKGLIERDKQRGLIRADIDTDLIVDMLYTLTLKEYNWIEIDDTVFIKKISDVVNIIRDGISTVRNNIMGQRE